jgi:hypothetical protein
MFSSEEFRYRFPQLCFSADLPRLAAEESEVILHWDAAAPC